MTIKNKIRAILSIPFLALTVITGLYLVDSYYDGRYAKQETAVIELVKKTFDTVVITNDILINGKKRGLTQLTAINQSVAALLSTLNFNENAQSDLLKGISTQHNDITRLCNEYYNIFAVPAAPSHQFNNRRTIVSNQLLLQSYSIVIKSLYLRDAVQRHHAELTNRLNTVVVILVGLFVIIIGFVTVKLGRDIVSGISRLQKGIETVSALDLHYVVPNDIPDEIGTLVSQFNMMSVKLRETYLELENEIAERKKAEEQLKTLNVDLESKVVEETQKRRQNEQIIIQQSKMAAMGEMLGLIAHQWRQPLNAISIAVQDVKDAFHYGELTNEYINHMVEGTLGQTTFMAKTIDDFREFFKPSKEKVVFDMKSAIETLLMMFGQLFKKNDIMISINAVQDTKLTAYGYPNEFKQVMLNMLNNASDAITEKRKSGVFLQGLIEITIDRAGDKIIVSIRDNGGGIPEQLLNKIFENYYTTKGKQGTGVGLYMSKTIIESNMGGRLSAKNVGDGAEFVITLAAVDELTQGLD